MSTMTEQLSWTGFRDRVAGGAVVLVPIGAHEQHGYHLPLGTDNFEVMAVCRGVAKKIDAVIAPTIPFGYRSQPRSGAGNHWPGNIALEGGTLVRLIRDVVVSLGAHAERIAVIDGHYENSWFLVEGCDQAARHLVSRERPVKVVRLLTWEAIPTDAWSEIYGQAGPVDLSLAHAGLVEAAAMLHVAPELVHMDREPEDDYRSFPPYDVYPPDPTAVPRSGTLSSPEGAMPELGRFIVQAMIDNVAQYLVDAFGLTSRCSPGSPGRR